MGQGHITSKFPLSRNFPSAFFMSIDHPDDYEAAADDDYDFKFNDYCIIVDDDYQTSYVY